QWATGQLRKFGGAAGNFGPGAAGVWKSLMSTGWYSPQQAAGVMGNMQTESGFDHLIVEGGSHSKHPENINAGWGLVQWTPGHKIAPYLKGDVSVGSQISALTAQLRGKGPAAEAAAGSALKATKTPETAAEAFLKKYERPKDDSQPWRATQARSIFQKFASGTHDTGGRER